MALRQTAQTGNWNTTTTWVGGIVPTAADTWEILNGHIVTVAAELTANPLTGTIKTGGRLLVAFQMTTSLFVGITIENGGDIYASRSISSVLRVGGLISIYGAYGINYGKVDDQISNIAVGAYIEIYCTADNQASRGIYCYVSEAVSFYGATRILNRTTLAQQAIVGAATIVLTDDLALRSGTSANWMKGLVDMIIIGANPDTGVYPASGVTIGTETDRYLVAGYDVGTKTVTLGDAGVGDSIWWRGGSTPNYNTIDLQREIGTYVYLVSSNVGMRGNAYNRKPATAIELSLDTLLLTGFYFSSFFYEGSFFIKCGDNHSLNYCSFAGGSYPMQSVQTGGSISYMVKTNWYHCIFSGTTYGGAYAGGRSYYSFCYFVGISSGAITGGVNPTAEDCFFDSCLLMAYITTGVILKRCRGLHISNLIMYSAHAYLEDLITQRVYSLSYYSPRVVAKSCSFSTHNWGFRMSQATLINCTLSNGYTDFYQSNVKCFSCYLLSTYTVPPDYTYTLGIGNNGGALWTVESFDHAGIAGDYKSWAMCGHCVSDATMPIGGLAKSHKFIFDREDGNPLFEEIHIIAQPNKKCRVKVYLRKDTHGMTETPSVSIFTPLNDPLFGGTPAQTFTMTDTEDNWQEFLLTVTPTVQTEYIVRVQARNATGNYWAAILPLENSVPRSRALGGVG